MRCLLLICLSACCVLAGCSTRVANFSSICATNLDLEKYNYEIDKTRRARGVDTAFIFVVIPFGLPDATTAVANAASGIPDCVGLANVGIKDNWFWLGLGYTQIEAIGYPIIKQRERK